MLPLLLPPNKSSPPTTASGEEEQEIRPYLLSLVEDAAEIGRHNEVFLSIGGRPVEAEVRKRLCTVSLCSAEVKEENESLERRSGRRRGDERTSDSGRPDLLLPPLILPPGSAGRPRTARRERESEHGRGLERAQSGFHELQTHTHMHKHTIISDVYDTHQKPL